MKSRAILLLSTGLLVTLSLSLSAAESGSAPSQATGESTEKKDIDELSLEELMNVKVNVATKTEQRQEEAPAIVSVISRNDIELYGDRDLSDILRRVPGFEFGVDVYGTSGQGFRGVWVFEGKMLFMINGMTVNDLAYGNMNFFGSFPAAMIDRVEILRGPGSALYGGFAGAGVVNVITRSGKDLKGARLQGTIGAMREQVVKGGNASFGAKTENVEVATHVGRSVQPMSQRDYKDFFGNSMVGGLENTTRTWEHTIAQMKYKDVFEFNFFRFEFNTGAADAYDAIIGPTKGANLEKTHQFSQGMNAKGTIPVGDHLTVEPTFEYIEGTPITINYYPSSTSGQYNTMETLLERYRGELAVNYGEPANGKSTLGVGYISDIATTTRYDGTPGLLDDKGNPLRRMSTDSYFAYGQYLRQFDRWGLTLGARYESTTFGDAFAPRAGLTYTLNEHNVKLLYGRAYRIPMPYQAYSSLFARKLGKLEPETSDSLEMEYGYRFSAPLKAKINVYSLKINKPIIYNGGEGSYGNTDEIQVYGAESEIEYRKSDRGGYANVSYTTPSDRSSTSYLTSDKENVLGLPKWKGNLGGYYRLGRWTLGPSFTYLGIRYGQTQQSSVDRTKESKSYPELILTNLSISWSYSKDTTMRLVGHNLFDVDYVLIQPYYGSHAPLPAQDRTIRFEVQTDL